MLRNTLIALGTLVLAACANPVRDAQETLTESLPVKTGVEFRAMQSYPGDVICGEYNAYESPTEAKQGFMPFITVRGALYKQPDKQQLAIYCSPDPAQQLLALAGVGPYDADNTTLPKITEDFAQLSGALERYVEDNYKYPTMEQGLQALVKEPTTGPRTRHYPRDGYISTIPQDPWGRPYKYRVEQWGGTRGQFGIYTEGADGVPGGGGANADVDSDLLPYLQHIGYILGQR